MLKVLAAGPSSSDAMFQFAPAQATDGMAAAASGGLEGLNLITRRDRYGKSALQSSHNQVTVLSPALRLALPCTRSSPMALRPVICCSLFLYSCEVVNEQFPSCA